MSCMLVVFSPAVCYLYVFHYLLIEQPPKARFAVFRSRSNASSSSDISSLVPLALTVKGIIIVQVQGASPSLPYDLLGPPLCGQGNFISGP